MGGVRQARRVTSVLVAAMLWSVAASAETSTELSASILVFPKVIFDGTRDTVVQISNTSNFVIHAHCFYVNAFPECTGSGDCLEGTCFGECVPRWQEVNFDLWLTKQQPTMWNAGYGRFNDPFDQPCRIDLPNHRRNDNFDCYGAGIDPGQIPPVPNPFVGELKCVEVDPSGAPISGNRFKGEATLLTSAGDSSKYNAIGFIGDDQDGDNTLCLGGQDIDPPDGPCPVGAEYSACPQTLIMDDFSEGADDPLLGPASTVHTELTLVPCTEDFEQQIPSKVVVQFQLFNEFEDRFSASTTVNCWGNFFLEDVAGIIFDVRTLGTRFIQARLESSKNSASGIIGVIEEYHRLGDATARAAFNLHEEGERVPRDYVVIPEGP